jgi:hypothetical protein
MSQIRVNASVFEDMLLSAGGRDVNPNILEKIKQYSLEIFFNS